MMDSCQNSMRWSKIAKANDDLNPRILRFLRNHNGSVPTCQSVTHSLTQWKTESRNGGSNLINNISLKCNARGGANLRTLFSKLRFVNLWVDVDMIQW
jgi:hypothetical protein